MSELKIVPLEAISMIQNYRDVEPPQETDADVKELADSIKKHGVMQAVLLRPAGKDRYELIFGHRRYLASKVAGNDSIPANVKEVADTDILELQVTENLQRKDVHPMDEAIAFLSLQAAKSLTVQDLADRFAKKPEYITQRLSFNKLNQDLQAKFKKNEFSIGHAIQIGRLASSDQKTLYESYLKYGHKSVGDVADWIDRHVSNKLSSAPFKTTDEKLCPAIGACTTCPKRSGANRLLFSDIDPKKDDRCFDKVCFEKKSEAAFALKLQGLLETKPDALFLVNGNRDKPNKEHVQLIKKLGGKVLEEDKDFQTWSYGKFKKKSTGFYINGWNRGETRDVYLPGAASKEKGKSAPDAIDSKEEIKKIQDREKRAKELDIEKIHAATLHAIRDNDAFKTPGLPMQPIDRGIMIFLLLENAGFQISDSIKKIKGLPKDRPYNQHGYDPEHLEKLRAISDNDLAFLIRVIANDKWGNPNLISGIRAQHNIHREFAKYLGVDLAAIEAEQNEKAVKRQERVKKRIADLKKPAKPQPTAKDIIKKKPEKKAAKKAGKKKPNAK